ncbi:MAG: hypothetical protein ACI8RA_002661 [Chlamydiales bacterium]|jgi:hypothetical protein
MSDDHSKDNPTIIEFPKEDTDLKLSTISQMFEDKFRILEEFELELQHLTTEIVEEEGDSEHLRKDLDYILERIKVTRMLHIKLQGAVSDLQQTFIHSLSEGTLCPEESQRVTCDLAELDKACKILDSHIKKINDIHNLIQYLEHDFRISEISQKIDTDCNPQQTLAELHQLQEEIQFDEDWDHSDDNMLFLKEIQHQVGRAEEQIRGESLDDLIKETTEILNNTLTEEHPPSEKIITLQSLLEGLDLIEEYSFNDDSFPLRKLPMYDNMMKQAQSLYADIEESINQISNQLDPLADTLPGVKGIMDNADDILDDIVYDLEVGEDLDIQSFIVSKYLLEEQEESINTVLEKMFQFTGIEDPVQYSHFQVALTRAQNIRSQIYMQMETTQNSFAEFIKSQYLRNKDILPDSDSLYRATAEALDGVPWEYRDALEKHLREHNEDATYLLALQTALEFKEDKTGSFNINSYADLMEYNVPRSGNSLEVLALSDFLNKPIFVFQDSYHSKEHWEVFLSLNDLLIVDEDIEPVLLFYNEEGFYENLLPNE